MFRKIIIEGNEYLWKYVFDDYDYQSDSSLVVKSADKMEKLVICFRTCKWDFGYCPFNKGVQAMYEKIPVIINLNQPRFIEEIVTFVLKQLQVEYLSGTIELNDGIEILHKLGYKFDYQKQWDYEVK